MKDLRHVTSGQYANFILALYVFTAPMAWGGEWRYTPQLELRETLTDNVTLAPKGREESDAVTQINPSIGVNGRGRRLNLSFYYRLQALFYAQDSERNDLRHQLRATAAVELIEDRFFIDAGASFGQRNIFNTGRVADDNINVTDNRTDEARVFVEPVWRERWGGYADTELRYQANAFRYETDQISNSDYDIVTFTGRNGRRSTQVAWNYDAEYRRETREDQVDDFETYRAEGEVRWPATREFYLVGVAGREESNFRTARQLTDGNFWSIGAGWSPSRFFTVEAGKGKNNEFVNLSLVPSRRSFLHVRYRDRAVGFNPGVTYGSRFEYRTRKARFAGTYAVQTTTAQQSTEEIQIGSTRNPFEGSDRLFDESECLSDITRSSLPSLTNEVFVRDLFELSGGVRVGKRQDVSLAAYKQRFRFEESEEEQDSGGVCAAWTWQFQRSIRLTTTLGLNHIDYEESNPLEDDADDSIFRVRLNRTFARNLDGWLEYRYRNRNSSNEEFSYAENRIEARISKRF